MTDPTHPRSPQAARDGLREALAAFFEDIDADWSNDNIRPGDFAFRFRHAADRLRAALAAATPEPPDLSALRRLSEAATPGPWGHPAQPWPDEAASHLSVIDIGGRPVHGPRNWKEACANHALSAAAVNYVRSLLAQQPETGEPR